MGKDVNIPFSFAVKNPPVDRRYLLMTWYFQGKEILSVQSAEVKPTDPRMSYKGRAEDGIADLSISNITIMDGGIYKCSILYRAEKEEKEIRLDVQAPPQITLTDKVVLRNKASSLSSIVSGFYPVDIDIKWLRDGEILDSVIMEKPERNPDGTYNVKSSVTIISTKEESKRIFSCRVQHESLNSTLQENFQLVYGALPYVHIASQAFKLNVEQKLVCSASDFYPESITVRWLLNGTLVENAKTRRISISAVESVYHFIPTEQNWGAELSCVVEHGTLITPHVETLLVQATDLTAQYKIPIVFASALLVVTFGSLIIVALLIKQRNKRLPKVREITRSSGVAFSLNVDHFSPNTIKVCWEVIQPPSNTQSSPIESTIIMQQNQDKTFNATSTCESLRGSIIEDQPYVVRAEVQHSKMKHPAYREWRSDDKDNKDFLASPEVNIIQIPTLLVKKQTQLQCTISHFYPDDLTIDWLVKEKGKLELTPIGNSGRYKIPNSTSQSQPDKTFTHTALLEFTPLLEDQESEIICKVNHRSLNEPIERTTGPLVVLAQPELQQPINLSVTDSGDVVGSAILVNFYPKDIKVTWTCNPVQNQEETTRKEADNPDGTFQLDSQCKIPGKLLTDSQFNMKVEWNHEAMEKPEYREISIRGPDFPWHPRIEDVSPLILQVGKETKVMCKISGYFPENIKVTWLNKDRKPLTAYNYGIHDIKHERTADNTYQCSPSLSFTPKSQEEDLEFICSVEHPSLEKPIEQSTGPPRINVTPQELKDVKFTIRGSDQVLCSLSIMKFYPQNIKINWIYNRYTTLSSTKKIIQTDDEKTFDAVSECTIPWKYLESSVRVTWTHESLKEPGHRDLRLTDFPWRPVIEEMDRSPLLENTKATLQFKISHYFPSNLFVTWHKKEKNGKLTPFPKYAQKYTQDTSRPQLQPDKTYSCTTSLQFTPTLPLDQGSEFICRVEHPSLEKPIEKSTGPLEVCALPKYQDPIQSDLTNRREADLILRLHKFYPRQIDIKWSCICGQSLTPHNEYENNDDTTFNVTSKCRVPREHKTHPNPTIRVTWKHIAMTDPESREVCARDKAIPEVTDPVKLTPCESEEVLCSVRLGKFFPKNINFTWTFGGKAYSVFKAKKTLLVEDGMEIFGAISECRIPWRHLQFPVRVSWEHESMEAPQYTELPGPDFPWLPQVEVLDPPCLILNTESKIQCRIFGYFPKDLTVKWFEREEKSKECVPVANSSKYKIPNLIHQRQPDNTYSCTASLLLTPSRKIQGLEFICSVGHPKMEQPTETRITPLQLKSLS
ncbi:uncharacterized protein ACMZJ9_009975 [Mantella aurantiaca]